MECAADLMSSPPVTVHEDCPISGCARQMLAHGIRHLLTTISESGQIGLVYDFSVFHTADQTQTARDVAEPAQLLVRPDAPLMPLLGSLADSFQDMVVVVDNDQVVGVITEHDAVRAAAQVMSPALRVTTGATSDPITVRRSMTVRDATRLLFDKRVRHLIIVEGRALVGVLSLRDLLHDDVAEQPALTVGDLLSRVPFTVSMQSSLAVTAALMVERKIGCVPVVDTHDRPRGVLTRTDVLRALVASLEQRALFPHDEPGGGTQPYGPSRPASSTVKLG